MKELRTRALKPLILNVGDDSSGRSSRTRWLKAGNLDVIEAGNGAAALALVAAWHPPLVLLDVTLPGLDGHEVCRRIKTDWPEIIVIELAAAVSSTTDMVNELENGADCYLTIPAGPMELISLTRAMLRLHQAEKQAADAVKAVDARLETLVAERTQELAATNDRLMAEITQRERAEERLRQSQKIEALGQLTGGIAHDLNNLLTAILGGLEVTRRRIEEPRTLRLIDSAISAAERGSKLIAQLTAFARKQKLHVSRVALNTLVSDMQELLERSVGSIIKVSLDLTPEAWPVLVDANQLQMALLNLTINARDAMPTGGTVRITTRNEVVDEAAGGPTLRTGAYGAVCVQDSGVGMTQAVQARLFEPFFTTKDVGKGSGLGLAQVYGFVRQSGGDVRVQSVLGRGTSITILLPRASPDADAPAVDETVA